MDTLELGSAPSNEDCVQVSRTEDYIAPMKNECRRYLALLETLFPVPEDVKAWFFIKSNPHDFGTYYEVAIRFDDEDDKSVSFAYSVEENLPENWPLTPSA